jgi:hypothetical protein
MERRRGIPGARMTGENPGYCTDVPQVSHPMMSERYPKVQARAVGNAVRRCERYRRPTINRTMLGGRAELVQRRRCHIARLCSMGAGSDTTYFIPPPPPPIDAQLGRIPAVHTNAIAVNHLNVR